jgi:Peptidase family M23
MTAFIVALLIAGPASPATAGGGALLLVPPVDAPISRPFQAPDSPYGSGHRGVDYTIAPGTRIRAAAAGTVTFAGSVAGSRAITIQHQGGVRTTYSVLSQIFVHGGDEVEEGQWLGEAGVTHPGQDSGLHFGVKVDDLYVDPALFFGQSDVSDALHLAPLAWEPVPQVSRLLALPAVAGDYRRPCSRPQGIATSLPPPDANIAVAVAGIGSKTAGGLAADLYEYGPERLGYRPDKVFWFSYRGVRGPHLHQPYSRTDTYGDIRAAVRRLRRLMLALGRRFPGVDVDLFGHSLGGVVARLFLESETQAWDPRFPRVAHLVTFAAPNRGAPLASLPGEIRGTEAGRSLLRGVSRWSKSGAPVPDPLTAAVAQLAPGSSLMRAVARQDVAYGTQVLTLTSPFDVVVPADRASIAGQLNRVVPSGGLDAHSAIVRSEPARRIEYSFLRGGPVACRGWWDRHGRTAGAGIDWAERHLGNAFRAIGALVPSSLGWGHEGLPEGSEKKSPLRRGDGRITEGALIPLWGTLFPG